MSGPDLIWSRKYSFEAAKKLCNASLLPVLSPLSYDFTNLAKLCTAARAGTVRIGRLTSFRPLFVLLAVLLSCLDRLGLFLSHLCRYPPGLLVGAKLIGAKLIEATGSSMAPALGKYGQTCGLYHFCPKGSLLDAVVFASKKGLAGPDFHRPKSVVPIIVVIVSRHRPSPPQQSIIALSRKMVDRRCARMLAAAAVTIILLSRPASSFVPQPTALSTALRTQTHHAQHAALLDPYLLETASSSLLSADCLLYTSPSPRDVEESRMPSSA